MSSQPHRHREFPSAAAGLRTALLLAPALLLSGCTVGFWTYQQIAAPQAQYVQVNCDGRVGPPKLAYYPFQGISIGVAVTPLDLRLRTPRGVHAHLDGDSVVVSGHTDKGNVEVTMHLKTAAQASDAGSLSEVRFEERHDSSWQPGAPTADIQIDAMTAGTIRLPPIIIDGTTWPAQTLTFTRKVYPEIMKNNAACPAPP
jgi:hypothetical protein